MENKIKLLWLIFVLITLIIVQQCSVMIISKPAEEVNIDHQQRPDVEVMEKDKSNDYNDTIKGN